MKAALFLVAVATLTACPPSGPVTIICRSNSNCPTGQGCSSNGICEPGIVGMNGARFAVSPSTANVVLGSTVKLVATLDGMVVAATWSVADGKGSIDAEGTYTAPATLPADNVATVTAARTDDPSTTATGLIALHPVLPLPALTSITPNTANAGALDLVLTVTGTDFGPTTDVLFDGVRVQTRYDSSTQLTATVPAAELANGRVAIVTARTPGLGGTSSGASFTINNLSASLGAITPASALAGAPSVSLVLSGAGFAQGAVVTFGGTAVPTTFTSTSQLGAMVPAAQLAKSGVFTVAVRNPAPGGGGAGDQVFRVDAVIKTVAGGFTGDNGIAASAALSRITWMAFHPVTNELYYSEPERHRVMKIDLTGRVRKVTGTGVCGFSGDGAAASQAVICTPRGLGFDPAGNLFFADGGNARLRKIDTLGTITTVAGTGTCNYAGEGVAASTSVGDITDVKVAASGNIYFSAIGCSSNHRVRRIANGVTTNIAGNGLSAVTISGLPAATNPLNNPVAIEVDDAENLYLAEFDSHRIRFVGANGLIQTVAGNGGTTPFTDGVLSTTSSVQNPRGLALDNAGNLLVTSYNGLRLRKVTAEDAGVTDGGVRTISTVAGTGVAGLNSGDGMSALMAKVGHVAAVALSNDGGVYFSSTSDVGAAPNSIRRLDSAGNVQLFAGIFPPNATALDSFFYRPYGVALDATGNLYVSDREGDRVWKVDAAGAVTMFAGTGLRGFSGEGGPATQAAISQPEAIQADTNGDVYFVDSGNGRIRKVDASGNIATVAGGGSTPGGCSTNGVPATAPMGAGTAYNCFGDDYFATAAVLVGPRGFLKAGSTLYVTEYDVSTSVFRGNRVRKVNLTTGVITTIAGGTAYGNNNGFSGDNGPATGALLFQPVGLAMDAAGDLFVADSGNRRVRKINLVSTPIGNISTIAGTGALGSSGNGGPALVAQFRRPWWLAFDAAGALYVSDFEAHNIRRIEVAGTVTPITGAQQCATCAAGLAGDGAAAKDATLYQPAQIAVSPTGQLFIADSLNERIRALGP